MSAVRKFIANDLEVYSIAKAEQASLDFSNFKCENQLFTDYLIKQAADEDRRNIARVWLFVTHQKDVVGYVTLIMSQLVRLWHPSLSKLTTHNNVPGLLISEMAGHIEHHGKGLGRLMINWVVSVALDLSKYAACRLIIVQSVPDKIDMYKHWGFEPVEEFEEHRYTMFLELPRQT